MLRILLACVVAFPLLTSYRGGGGEERGGERSEGDYRGQENRGNENREQGNYSQQQKNEAAAHHYNDNNLNYQQKQDLNRAYDNREGYGNGGNVYVAPQPQTVITPVQEYPQNNNSPYVNTPNGAVYPDLPE